MSDRSNSQNAAGGVLVGVLALFGAGGKACTAAKVGAGAAAVEAGAAARSARYAAEASAVAHDAGVGARLGAGASAEVGVYERAVAREAGHGHDWVGHALDGADLGTRVVDAARRDDEER